jgi:DNA-binding LacI/PurR family transcriptional regulator
MIDIAAEAGVSQSAVSYVLNGRGQANGIGEKTAARILQVAKRLKFSPNRAAQELAGKRSGVVAVLANTFFDAWQHRTFGWVSHLASPRGLQTLGWESDSTTFTFEKYVGDCLARNVEGLIYLTFDKDVLRPQDAKTLARIPRVISLFDDPGVPGGYCVDFDSADGVRQAVTLFHRQGRRKIVQVLENLDTIMSRRRHEGFLAAHAELGRELPADHLCLATQGWTRDDYPKFAPLVDQLIDEYRADAILAESDLAGAFLVKYLQRRGLRTPEDVSVIGWGDDLVSRTPNPALTTVSFRLQDMVTGALDLLTDLIERPDHQRERTIRIKPELLVREST